MYLFGGFGFQRSRPRAKPGEARGVVSSSSDSSSCTIPPSLQVSVPEDTAYMDRNMDRTRGLVSDPSNGRGMAAEMVPAPVTDQPPVSESL